MHRQLCLTDMAEVQQCQRAMQRSRIRMHLEDIDSTCTAKYDRHMTSGYSLYRWLIDLGRGFLRWLAGWWSIFFVGAKLMVLAFSPSSYRSESRGPVLRHMYFAAGPGLPGFTTLMALFNVVVIRIVVVTAFSYGLTQYALDAVVRVLVLELIPLVAALFVAVEYTIPGGSDLYKRRRSGEFEALRARGIDPLSHEVLPRVLAGVFAVLPGGGELLDLADPGLHCRARIHDGRPCIV